MYDMVTILFSLNLSLLKCTQSGIDIMAFGCVFFEMFDRGYTKLPTKYKQVKLIMFLLKKNYYFYE